MTRGPWHVAVLMGGWSAEREVSLMSGKGIADALESRGHRVTRIDMGRDVARRLAEAKPDIGLNAINGVPELGRAWCRERGWQFVLISVAAVSLKKKKQHMT